MAKEKLTYVLTGAPNCGKSSLFNRLTGLNQKVGNYPGVTVDKYIGQIRLEDGNHTLIDLPGTYSLYPSSDDERVVLDVLTSNEERPDFVLHVLDATHLSRSMLLYSQVVDLGYPVICLVNMNDMAGQAGIEIDLDALSERLGTKVIAVNGRTGKGLKELSSVLGSAEPSSAQRFRPDEDFNTDLLKALVVDLDLDSRYAAHLLACQQGKVQRLSAEQFSAYPTADTFNPIRAEVSDKQDRIGRIEKRIAGLEKRTKTDIQSSSTRADRILTHPVWGTLIFFLILFLLFQSVFTMAVPLMDMVDGGMASLSAWLQGAMPAGVMTDLLIDGVLAGIGGVVIFIPQIAILFGLIAMLEESGYMTRAVYLSDKLMHKAGLNGRSLVSLISGVACAVPAVMATRTIANWKERLITIFVTPFMSCSARLPVYVVLIAFIVPDERIGGLISMQGLLMFGLYMLGTAAAILTAFIMKKILKTGEASFLMMELPKYQMPQWRNVLYTILQKSKVFVWEAGKVILFISIILWALSSYGPGDAMDLAEAQVEQGIVKGEIAAGDRDDAVAAYRLESSYVGHLGKAIEPAIRPLGFDWKMGIALITSFAAREVFVGSMATIYSAGSTGEDEQSIIQRMRQERDIRTQELVYTPVRSMSLLLFYVFAMQCMSTLAVVKRETKSWQIPILQFVVMTGLAYLASLTVWQIWG